MSEAAMAIPMRVFLRTDAALLLGVYIYLCQLVVAAFQRGCCSPHTHTHTLTHIRALNIPRLSHFCPPDRCKVIQLCYSALLMEDHFSCPLKAAGTYTLSTLL